MTWPAPLVGESLSLARSFRHGSLLAGRGDLPAVLRLDFTSPAFWGVVLAAFGLCLMLPSRYRLARRAGSVIALVGLGLIAAGLPWLSDYVSQSVFWVLAGATVISAAAAVATRSPVYAALWFALSLLGAAGLFLFQGAQFLAVGTVVVYAGAIVVTFLFVIMLAQPQGYAAYDRISWGWTAKPAATLAAAAMVAVLTCALDAARQGGWRERVAVELSAAASQGSAPPIRADQLCGAAVRTQDGRRVLQLTLRNNAAKNDPEQNEILRRDLQQCLAPLLSADGERELAPSRVEIKFLDAHEDVLHPAHMAHLGGQLFGRHLVSVEAAGTLLLAALIGAVAIVIQGKLPRERRESSSHE